MKDKKFTNEKFEYYLNKIKQNDKKNLYEKIKDIETTNIYLLEYREELRKELYN